MRTVTVTARRYDTLEARTALRSWAEQGRRVEVVWGESTEWGAMRLTGVLLGETDAHTPEPRLLLMADPAGPDGWEEPEHRTVPLGEVHRVRDLALTSAAEAVGPYDAVRVVRP
jgi:hypothetical protein